MVSEAPGLDTGMEPLREGFSLLDRSISPPCGMTWSPQSFSIPAGTPCCLQAGKKKGIGLQSAGEQQNAELESSPHTEIKKKKKSHSNQIHCIKKDPLASPSVGTEEFNTWNAAKG